MRGRRNKPLLRIKNKIKRSMEFIDKILEDGEYFKKETKKDTICLHHTAGGHRPDWTTNYWNTDRNNRGSRIRVATHFAIGGISTSMGDDSWDGKIVRCMDEKYWAHHLGIKAYNNTHLNQKTIGIEICNYGPIRKSNNGDFYNYVNKLVPADQVIELEESFRGYKYWHKYTKKQIDATKKLILYLKNKHNIDIDKGLKELLLKYEDRMEDGLSLLEQQKWLNNKGYKGENNKLLVEDGLMGKNTKYALDKYNKHPFEINEEALDGVSGLWSHINFRKDKFDCSPQPDLIKMIKTL